jgi:hypothetical protein
MAEISFERRPHRMCKVPSFAAGYVLLMISNEVICEVTLSFTLYLLFSVVSAK